MVSRTWANPLAGAMATMATMATAATLVACAGAPPPVHAAEAVADPVEVVEPAPSPSEIVIDAPERTRAPSKASYEESMSSPEGLDVHDDRPHLSDAQLAGPMQGVTSNCRVPAGAKITVRTAVQGGRAIGVTVAVRFAHAKGARRLSKAAAKYETKTAAKIVACVDRAVRAVVWPPSSRRDSFVSDL